MRPVSLVAWLLFAIFATTAHALAQVAAQVGDHYEAYTALKTCTISNCNLSFPRFDGPGILLIEEVSCRASSETTIPDAQFGPTSSPESYAGNKRAFFTATSNPSSSFSLYTTFHATPSMLMAANRYLTMNFFVNSKTGIFYTYISCAMAGRVLQ